MIRPPIWQAYVSPSGRFVMRWCLGIWWQRMDGRLNSVGVGSRRLWSRPTPPHDDDVHPHAALAKREASHE